MKTILQRICLILGWLYAGLIILWFVLHRWLGDTVWWLALLNSFTPYFFLPLVLILPACFVCRQWSFRVSVIPSVLIFLILYGHLFLPNWSRPSTTNATTLTIMTFNIWGGSKSKETARVILDNGSPDIVAIQELTPQMAEILLEEVGEIYPFQILKPESQHRGVGILSRYPLTELDSNHLFDPDWQLQIMQVEVDNHSFTFYNVHPQATNILVYFESGTAVADEVQNSFQNRKRLMQRLIADFEKKQGPIVVVGDFNSTDQSDIYTLLNNRLTDAHQAAGWGFGHTFPAYAGSFRGIPILPKQMRIDMIFYSEEFSALSSRVGSTYGESDHLPVLAQLAW